MKTHSSARKNFVQIARSLGVAPERASKIYAIVDRATSHIVPPASVFEPTATLRDKIAAASNTVHDQMSAGSLVRLLRAVMSQL